MKQTFEYHVDNIVIPYKTLTKGVAMFKHKEDTLEPDDHALLNPLRWAEVVRLGQEGWELVSVQPLMRGVTEIGNQNAPRLGLGRRSARQLPAVFQTRNLIKKYPGPAPSISCGMESGRSAS